jgi:pimeloyl-ACP methyl ester carboxylesterase
LNTPVEDVVSSYDRLVFAEGEIESLLATGQRRREVMAWLGEAEYLRLQPLAVAAAAAQLDPDRCVYIVPGIMGSQLGIARAAPLPANLLWVDPVDIQHGGITRLAFPGEQISACGVVLYNYLPLKLALEAAGFTVRFHDYDWRRDMTETGFELAQRIGKETARHIYIVAHSMGGLLGRVALQTPAGARITQLITLGTPHGGSFAPVLALRGVYPLVRRIAQLDPQRTAETLARDVFATFHSLYQMLPTPDARLNLFNARSWPSTGPQPNATLLDRAPFLKLGGIDQRIVAVAGTGHDTVVNLVMVQDEFFYRLERAGDGTVPTSRAVLPGCSAWYCDIAHSELPRSIQVREAVIQLLLGSLPALAAQPPATAQSAPLRVSDSDLRSLFNDKIDWAKLDTAGKRRFLDSLNGPATPLL